MAMFDGANSDLLRARKVTFLPKKSWPSIKTINIVEMKSKRMMVWSQMASYGFFWSEMVSFGKFLLEGVWIKLI